MGCQDAVDVLKWDATVSITQSLYREPKLLVASNIERKHPIVLTPIAKGRHSDITIVLS